MPASPRTLDSSVDAGLLSILMSSHSASTKTRAAARCDSPALTDTERQLRAVLDNTSAGVFLLDKRQNCTFMNAAAEALTGFTLGEVMGRPLHMVLHHSRPDGSPYPIQDCPIDRAFPERSLRQGEECFVHKDGSFYPVAYTASPVEDDASQVVGTVLEIRSLAAEKAAANNLRASEAALATRTREFDRITEAVPAAIYINDRTMRRTTFINPAATRILGYMPAEMNDAGAETLREMMHPEDLPIVDDMFRRIDSAQDGEIVEAEYRMQRADGSYAWLADRIVALDRDVAGNVTRTLGVSVDVSERRRHQQELMQSETRFRDLFENANDYIFTTDRELRITSCNPSVAAALGHSQATLVGRSIKAFVAAETFEQNLQHVREILGNSEGARIEIDVQGRAGTMTWEIYCGVIRGDDGMPDGLNAIARDVTERKRFEAQQRLLIDELNHRVKNTLAIVQAIAHQTLRGTGTPADERAAFSGRLTALAGAHSVLSRVHWVAADMREVAAEALRTVWTGGRVSCDGPAIRLPPKTTVTMSLVLHEFCTNAARYGALSVPGGRVVLTWNLIHGTEPQLELRWVESGGPKVSGRTQTGFGLRMIERALAGEPGGKSEIRFEPEGVIFEAIVGIPRVSDTLTATVTA